MKVIDPGHAYDLDWIDGNPVRMEILSPDGQSQIIHSNRLTFVKREGPLYPGNVGHHPGTNIQEVLRALIDRVKYLDNQIPHFTNLHVLGNLRNSLWQLEFRAAERHGRSFDVSEDAIELEPFCPVCGHIGCTDGGHV